MNIFKVLLIFLVFMISLTAVSAVEDMNSTSDVFSADEDTSQLSENNAVIYADANKGNDSNDGLSRNTPVKTINKAYDLVASAGTIYLADGVYENPNLFIYKSLSIIGSNNTYVDGTDTSIKSSAAFRTMEGSYFEFKNIKFSNIKSKGSSAKVIFASAKSSKLIIENCDFINDTLKSSDTNLNFGPAPIIRIMSSINVQIINCNFINRIYYVFGKVETEYNDFNIISSGKLTINNTNFLNTANGFIYSSRNTNKDIASLNINNCSFINSYSSKNGGAISSDHSFTIINSSFINCSGNDGGAVYLDKSGNKQSINSYIENCYFENCYASANGGAISAYNANSLTINNSSFIKCTASEALYGFGGSLYATNSNVFLNDIIFSECKGKGAAIYNQKGTVILNNSIIKNSIISGTTNMNVYYLGSILNVYGNLSVISSIFENNKCVDAFYSRMTCIGTAGIYNRGTLDVSYSAFLNNSKIKQDMYNDIYTESSDVKSLDFNWWGSDENPTELGLSNYQKIHNWFYMDIVPEYLALNINETANISSTFKLSNPNIAFDSGKIPKFNIAFSSKVNDKSFFESKNLVNNSASVSFDLTQTKGQYVLFTSIDAYSKPTIIDVGKNVSLMDVNVSDIMYGNDLKVNVTVINNHSQSLNGNVTFIIDKKTYNAKLNNGHCNVSVSGLIPGKYTLKVIYEGDDNYFKNIQYFNVTVNKIPTNLSISMPEIIYIGNKAIFNTTLMPDNFKIRANLYINGNRTNILYIYGGNTTISLGVLPVGEYNFTVELWNHTYYESSAANTSFNVVKYDVNLTIYASDIRIGENATVIINSSPQDFKGYATLEINGQNQSVFIYNNQTNVTIHGLNAGKYDLKLYYDGDAKFKNTTVFSSFNVLKNKLSLNMTVDEGFVVVKTNYTNCTGLVYLYFNDDIYSMNLTDGVVNFPVTYGLGYNYIYAYYVGDDYYDYATVNITYFVPDIPGLTGEDLMIYEHSGEDYVINLNNDLGYPIVNATVSIEIDGKKYNVTTNFEGYAKLPLNLNVGDYVLSASYEKYHITNNISVKPINLMISLKDKIAQNQNQTITVKVSSGVIGQISFELNNKKYIADINDSGIAQINISNLAAGNYTIKVQYINEIYNSPYSYANFSVYKYYAPISIDLNDTLHGNDVLIKVTLPDDAKGSVSFIVNNNTYIGNIVEGVSWLTLSDLDIGTYNVDVYYSGDSHYYNNAILDKKFKVFKHDSILDVNVDDTLSGSNVIIDVYLDKNATGNITFIVDKKEYSAKIISGKAVLVLSNLSVKTYDLSVYYSGDIHYNSNQTDLTFTIKTAISDITLQVNDAIYSEKIIIKANVTRGATGNVTFNINNYSYIVEIVNSTAILNISGFDAGTYDVVAKYSGDNVYLSSVVKKSFNINKAQSNIDIVVNPVVGENIRIYAVVSPNATGNVTFRMLGYYSPRDKLIKGNNASWLISPLKTGQYTIIAIYNGDNNYLSSNITYYLSVNQIKTKLTVEINNVSKTSDVFIKATLKTVTGENIDGQVMVSIGEYDYIVNVNDGYGVINISKLNPGIYNYSAVYSGSKSYYRSISEGMFVIEDSFEDVKLIADPLIKYYGGNERLTVYLTDSNYNPIENANLYIKVNGVEYRRITNSRGLASMAVNLNSGNYTADIRFEGFNRFNALSSSVKIIIKSTVEGLNITKIFRNATQYHAIFSDSQGNPLVNKSVKFNINGVFYTRVTNGYGIARLNINLNPGSYVLTAENPVTGELKSNLITVLSSIVENKDLNMYYRNGSKYIVKLLGNDGKAIAGEKVTFNINGIFYTRISDSEGYARLNINLAPDSYIITADYNGCRVSNTIVVKPVLFTNDLSFRYGSGASFEATLVDGQGRYYPNQKITFNINGLFYERITNYQGVASLNIRLLAGKYIITSSFNDCNVANTITIY